MLAHDYFDRIMEYCLQAKAELDKKDIKRALGWNDEIRHDSEGVKWILVDMVKNEKG